MTGSNRGHRPSRRMLVAGALVIAGVLAGVAVAISRVPAGRPVSTAAPRPAVVAGSAPVASAWAALTPVEQKTLKPLQDRWAALDAPARTHWVKVADRLQGKPSRAVGRAAQHMAAWQQLSSAQRAQARLHYVMASRLSPAERQQRWAAYQARANRGQAPGNSAPAFTMVSPSMAAGTPGTTTMLVTDLHPDTLPRLHVPAVQAISPASTAMTGDAS